jgi:hypothetical protein
MIKSKKSGSSRGTKCSDDGRDGGRDCGRVRKKMEETRGTRFVEDLLTRLVSGQLHRGGWPGIS